MKQYAIVAGGASGIGAALAESLRRQQWEVAVLDRRADTAANEIEVDFRDADATASAIQAAAGAGIDALIITAGVGVFGSVEQTSDSAWRAAVEHNLTGPFHVLRAAVPYMSTGSAIVTVGSTNVVAPLRFEGPYSASKAGLVALSQSLALELAPRVRVNAVSHSLIDTPFIAAVTGDPEIASAAARNTPMQRIGTTDDACGLIRFLIGPEASYITGQHFVIDGGGTLPRSQSDAIMQALMRTRLE